MPLTVAVNCCVPPVSSEGDVGEIETVALTDSTSAPVVLPCMAEIVVRPMATAVAIPTELTVAAAVSDELQVAELVRF